MTIHRSRPDADGNPGTTLCGTQLNKGVWMKTHAPDCPDCNRVAGVPAPRLGSNVQRSRA